MENDFKENDRVQILHNPNTPKMVISAIHMTTKQADCFWHDNRTQKDERRTFPLNVLVHCPDTDKEILKKQKRYPRPLS